jgi:hypothetical protein
MVRQRRGSLALCVLGIIAALVLIDAAAVGWHVLTLWRHGSAVMALADHPGEALRNGEVRSLEGHAAAVEGSLTGLRGALGWVLRPVWLPSSGLRANLEATDELLRVGVNLAHAARLASPGMVAMTDGLLPQAGSAQDREATEVLFESMVRVRGAFEELIAPIDQAAADVTELGSTELWAPLARVQRKLGRYLRLGRAGIRLAVALPDLLGEGHGAQYMVLAQNNDELRPTGGFITAIGLVPVEAGKVGELSVFDSYDVDKLAVDHPPAPEPMQRYMSIYLWVTRDGNWSPDFVQTAQDVRTLYHLENQQPVDGVVAFDMYALAGLVAAVGPVELADDPEPITGDNVIAKMREYWGSDLPAELESAPEEQRREWRKAHRKDFVAPLGKALMRSVRRQSDPGQLAALLKALLVSLDEKHIQMFFDQSLAQEALSIAGWDGALDQSPYADYSLALDTNMGYNKVNANVTKSLRYEVDLSDSSAPVASLTITYSNASTEQAECLRTGGKSSYDMRMQGCYWNYLRVYATGGSELLSTEGVTVTEKLPDERGKTVWGTFLVVPGGTTSVVRFRYRLPSGSWQPYRLAIQKQGGSDAVSLEVLVSLPAGANYRSATPQPQQRAGNQLLYQGDLRQDRTYMLTFR